mmetsp:Transcript_17690/g.41509  ORF Transcript_17690/g.41509 Transcript_17690/m.41509 type:complete len:280 (+) Transcript_17690:1138-1977(+)
MRCPEGSGGGRWRGEKDVGQRGRAGRHTYASLAGRHSGPGISGGGDRLTGSEGWGVLIRRRETGDSPGPFYWALGAARPECRNLGARVAGQASTPSKYAQPSHKRPAYFNLAPVATRRSICARAAASRVRCTLLIMMSVLAKDVCTSAFVQKPTATRHMQPRCGQHLRQGPSRGTPFGPSRRTPCVFPSCREGPRRSLAPFQAPLHLLLHCAPSPPLPVACSGLLSLRACPFGQPDRSSSPTSAARHPGRTCQPARGSKEEAPLGPAYSPGLSCKGRTC